MKRAPTRGRAPEKSIRHEGGPPPGKRLPGYGLCTTAPAVLDGHGLISASVVQRLLEDAVVDERSLSTRRQPGICTRRADRWWRNRGAPHTNPRRPSLRVTPPSWRPPS